MILKKLIIRGVVMDKRKKQIQIAENIIDTRMGISKVLRDGSKEVHVRALIAGIIARFGDAQSYIIASQ